MVIDKNGFLIVVMVSTACINHGKVARLLARFVKELCCSIKVILADAGTGAPIKSKRLSGTYLIFK